MSIDGQHIIELAKVTDYLLSTTHPTGRAKAAFFNAFGFDAANPVRFAHSARNAQYAVTWQRRMGAIPVSS